MARIVELLSFWRKKKSVDEQTKTEIDFIVEDLVDIRPFINQNSSPISLSEFLHQISNHQTTLIKPISIHIINGKAKGKRTISSSPSSNHSSDLILIEPIKPTKKIKLDQSSPFNSSDILIHGLPSKVWYHIFNLIHLEIIEKFQNIEQFDTLIKSNNSHELIKDGLRLQFERHQFKLISKSLFYITNQISWNLIILNNQNALNHISRRFEENVLLGSNVEICIISISTTTNKNNNKKKNNLIHKTPIKNYKTPHQTPMTGYRSSATKTKSTTKNQSLPLGEDIHLKTPKTSRHLVDDRNQFAHKSPFTPKIKQQQEEEEESLKQIPSLLLSISKSLKTLIILEGESNLNQKIIKTLNGLSSSNLKLFETLIILENHHNLKSIEFSNLMNFIDSLSSGSNIKFKNLNILSHHSTINSSFNHHHDHLISNYNHHSIKMNSLILNSNMSLNSKDLYALLKRLHPIKLSVSLYSTNDLEMDETFLIKIFNNKHDDDDDDEDDDLMMMRLKKVDLFLDWSCCIEFKDKLKQILKHHSDSLDLTIHD
ncbi:hypothetical protein CROQUDRAFT_716628 [Cronartium quercuum f. sp. fusiforme G11]|uniref:Uncharacterized protein n=1 Tax=Cronartium quercuum f. sp. fusiforme G11 TaxID=708437 RepID=A0A9P6NI78_9BASI|nr:hypothetical protein CROQUDRAFT_716628 [Cronartium quercuum f. sp. fusiforme G11]